MDVCIVGSMRFREKIAEVGRQLKSSGIAHSLPRMDLAKEEETPRLTGKLVFEHFRKIDECKILYVVNPGGYLGNSVTIEVGYAKGRGKRIFFMEKTNLPEFDCLADGIVREDELLKLKEY